MLVIIDLCEICIDFFWEDWVQFDFGVQLVDWECFDIVEKEDDVWIVYIYGFWLVNDQFGSFEVDIYFLCVYFV